MKQNELIGKLSSALPVELCNSIVNAYVKSVIEQRKGNWKYVGNELGQFIENLIRIVQYKTLSTYTPLADKLPIINEVLLKQFEQSTICTCESYRLIIPRCLYSMYCIRNKRGMIHANTIDPNKMDASVLLNNAKWILAELIRLETTTDFEKANTIINEIIDKEIDLIWDTGSVLRILNTKMTYKDQVLCLLYKKNNQIVTDLLSATEHSNKSSFNQILRNLHKARLLELSNNICTLSPAGILQAEQILKQQ